MNRKDYMQWCKKRAHDYLARGDVKSAVASMCSDLGKHPETDNLQRMAVMMGMSIKTTEEAQSFIDGFRE